MKKYIFFGILLFLLLIILGDNKDPAQDGATTTQPPAPITPTKDSRSFLMGFSSWPPSFDIDEIKRSLELAHKESDVRLVHLDGGVPWEAMINKKPIPKHAKDSWDLISNYTKNSKIFVAITPLNFGRDDIAPSITDKGDNQENPDSLDGARLNSQIVKDAYLAYAQQVMEYWKPEYLAIGIEANTAINKNINTWEDYKELHQFVYTALKNKYPNTLIFSTVQVEHFKCLPEEGKGKEELQRTELRTMLPYNDILALSTYPYAENDNEYTDTYLDEFNSYQKSVAISETGWPSAQEKIFGLFPIKGSPEEQSAYLDSLLRYANEHQFIFVINWVNVDFVKLHDAFPVGIIREIAKLWIHTGLWDEYFNEKPALGVWRVYLSLPVANPQLRS